MGLLDGKLFNIDLVNLKFCDTALSYELRLGWEALCAVKVHGGDFPEFVV